MLAAAAIAMAVAVGVAFGVHDAVAKISMEGADPSSLSFATLLLGLPLLAIMVPFAGGLRLTYASLALFIAAGVVNFSLGRTLMYSATSRLTSSGASVMTSTSAAFSLALGAALGEAIRPETVLGVIAIMASVYMVSGWGGRVDGVGVLLGLATGFAIALSVALIKLGDVEGGSPGLGVIIAYLSGMAALTPRARHASSMIRLKARPIAVMGLAAAAGQLMRYLALTTLGVDIVTPLQNLRPIVATSVLFGASQGESKLPRARHWAAAAIAFIGVALISGVVRL